MAQILVRGLEPEVLEKLKARAKQHGRSTAAEVRMILREAAETDWESARAAADRVRAMFAGRTFSDSAELIREDRER